MCSAFMHAGICWFVGLVVHLFAHSLIDSYYTIPISNRRYIADFALLHTFIYM